MPAVPQDAIDCDHRHHGARDLPAGLRLPTRVVSAVIFMCAVGRDEFFEWSSFPREVAQSVPSRSYDLNVHRSSLDFSHDAHSIRRSCSYI